MAPQGSGWELGGAASQTSLKVAPGEPGIDVTSPGVLEIGGDVATSVELGPSGVLVDAAGNVAARSFTATNGSNTATLPSGAATPSGVTTGKFYDNGGGVINVANYCTFDGSD